MSRTSRLFKLMDALRGRRQPLTAARLAEELAASVRTRAGGAAVGYLSSRRDGLPPPACAT
ncbi:MAG TPA: hypothetical protein VHV80_03055 [Steroidobacteraceae bacterium]|nr:hypothetical protein [Steroidobacteraceae bacterium]